MFKYSSTHILNNLKGVGTYASDGTAATGYAATNYLLVDTDAKIVASNVTKLDKATAIDAAVESVSFTMPYAADTAAGDTYRMYIYVRTADQADPLFANDWIYKGKPFQIEFKAGNDATATATNFVKNVGKWLNFVYGKKLITASNTSSGTASDTVTLTFAEGEYDLRFYKIKIERFTEATSANDYKYQFYADGAFTTVAHWTKGNPNEDNDLDVNPVTAGNSGFGTSWFLLKNLRLPTNANSLFLNPNALAGEMPVQGAKYNQYIITCKTDRPEMQGTSVVGQVNQSVTTHILWVLDDGVSGATGSIGKFEAELAKIYTASTDDKSVEDAN